MKIKKIKKHLYGGADQYNPDRCAWEVNSGISVHQCHRPQGHGKKGLFCKQHSRCKE